MLGNFPGKNNFFVFLACVVFVCRSIFAVTVIETDFISDSTGITNSWDLGATTYDEGDGRKFENDGVTIISPIFEGSAIGFDVQTQMYGQHISGSGSQLKIEARSTISDQWADVGAVVFEGGKVTTSSFKINRANAFCQFRLTFVKGNGTLRVRKFVVTMAEEGEVLQPYDLAAESLTTNSFTATWKVDDTVDSFLLNCWNVSLSDWVGTTVWEEDFSTFVNAGGNSKDIHASTIDANGWDGFKVLVPAKSEGVAQIGTTDKSGYLVSPALNAYENATIVVRARAYDKQSDMTMPVSIIRSGVTNEIARLGLTTSFVDYSIQGLTLQEGDKLEFKSFSVGSKRRVLVDSVALVKDYTPGGLVTNYICSQVSVDASKLSYTFDNLERNTEYYFSVCSVANGKTSYYAPACIVTTLANMPVKSAVCLSTLSRENCVRKWTEDFSFLSQIFEGDKNTAQWLNGVTFAPWQAFKGGDAVSEIVRNHGKLTTNGLYAYFDSNKSQDSYALGTMTGGTAPMLVYGLTFCNDTYSPIINLSIGFDGVQFGFNNKVSQDLYCEYCITELPITLIEDEWHRCDALTYTTSCDENSGLTSGESAPVKTRVCANDLEIAVPCGYYLQLRWRRDSITNAAAIGIDNLAISFKMKPRAFFIKVR